MKVFNADEDRAIFDGINRGTPALEIARSMHTVEGVILERYAELDIIDRINDEKES